MTEIQPVGWDRRPSGGLMFKQGRRHLMREGEDRTLCGVSLPVEVRRFLRGVRSSGNGMVGLVAPMFDSELADAKPCARCERSSR